jgi:acyl-coenzyme A thioesterase 13
MNANAQSIPAGFAPSQRSSNLLDLLGPLFEAGTGPEYRAGLRVDERHINTKGFCHGALLALLADVYLGRLIALSQESRPGLVTVSLSLTYLAPAKLGDWLEASGRIDRVGKHLAHSSATVTAEGTPVLRATGTFQITGNR